MPVIYLICMSPHSSSVLPSASGEQPSNSSLHELAAPKMHSRHVAMALVGSYPAFSPLPRRGGAVVFFCITHPSRSATILGSGMLCAARTFLWRHQMPATGRNTASLSLAREKTLFRHLASNIQSCHLRHAVRAHRDALLEFPWEFPGSVVCHLQLALLAGLNRLFRV